MTPWEPPPTGRKPTGLGPAFPAVVSLALLGAAPAALIDTLPVSP